MNISEYLDEISRIYKTGNATEHSYRAPLQRLFESIDDTAKVINEPKRSEGGMPDFLFQRDGVAFGWAEAKDLPKDVVKLKGYSVEQRKRYENAYPNLLYTNGVDFEFIRDKEVAYHVSIADFMGDLDRLQPLPENFERLESLLKDFAEQKPVSIRSAEKLAELMAGKAEIIKGEMGDELAVDPDFQSALGRQFNTFKDNLLPNLTPGEFADIYAETITYGMFAARLHDDTLDSFSRQEALEKLPKTNPFLRGLFQFIAGYDIPERLVYVVDDLAEVLRASNPFSLFEGFGKFTARNDPFIHFYETFLAAYNPKKRKSRGVWYTPEPVVDFIVRAVDDVLKTEFDLPDGLADTSKVSVKWDTGNDHVTGKLKGQPIIEDRQVHRVQILDPATGTGTFLAKTIQTISDRVKTKAPGKWSGYVEEELIPRIHGFELLMASYAMCHMKLDMMLRETGYTPSDKPPRLSVWLTNALEEGEREVRDLFFAPLANEARGANDVKRQTPIMCIIGNPPYSVSSSNNSDWIEQLVADYKNGLNERNIQPLSDDYIKFLRLAENHIQKNGMGILGFITNNSYLDGLIHRQMRHKQLSTFDKILIVDLHGSTKRKEVSPDGSSDDNVFDIQQGVSIIIAIKTGRKMGGSLAEVIHSDVWGKRKAKNEILFGMDLNSSSFVRLEPTAPSYYFVPKDFDNFETYSNGFPLKQLMPSNASGMTSHKNSFALDMDRDIVWERVVDLTQLSEEQVRDKYKLGKDTRDWKISFAREDVASSCSRDNLLPILYRPFDFRWTHYSGKTKGLLSYPRAEIMRHLVVGPNLALNSCRQLSMNEYGHALAVENVFDLNSVSLQTRERSYCFPLYLYPGEDAEQGDAFAPTGRTVNFDPKIYAAICEAGGLEPSPVIASKAKQSSASGGEDSGLPRRSAPRNDDDAFRAATGDDRPTEVKVFDYIYGVLHSPDYRETYKEFLKIDFPRIPYPKDAESFTHVSEKGEALRRLHLMEDAAIGDTAYPFMGEGDDVVVKPELKDGKVHINTDQYFDAVPPLAWEFYIGGYQPARTWLKDRKGRALSYDDIGHYQKIIKILCETDRIMKEIELPLAEN